ncbi:MAG: hypothetical protein AAGG50_17660 [Bacteroidota bacterium]
MPIPVSGETRALVVFLRFADDTHDNPCTDGARAWPHRAAMPSFAASFLADEPTAPFHERSFTQFFYQQSNRNFVLTGRSVGYVTEAPAEDYLHVRRGRTSNVLDHGRIAREALDALDHTIDYRDFDGNGDGYVDQVFIVARNTRSYDVAMARADGVSTLGFSEAPGGEAFDGMGFCTNCSGSFNRYQGMDPEWRLVQLLAHEYGHDLFSGPRYFGNHLDPISGNGVPFVPRIDSLGLSYADRTTGYALMLGLGSARHRAFTGPFLSAYERDLISMGASIPEERWIDCPTLERDTTVTLNDLVVTGDCVRYEYAVPPPPEPPPGRRARVPRVEALYLSNLQQATFFTTPSTTRTTVSSSCPGCRTVEAGGPHDTGLLIERTTHRAKAPHQAQRDLLPADNGLAGPTQCEEFTVGEGIEAAELFDGDLWDPDAVQQLTPWTRPNSFGTTFQRDITQVLREGPWPAFDALRYAEGQPAAAAKTASAGQRQPVRAITFDYVHDLREADRIVIRQDSWMDRGSDGLTLGGTLVVKPGATLMLEDSVAVNIVRGVRVEAGGTLHVQPGASLLLGTGAVVVVEGTLVADEAQISAMDETTGGGSIRLVGAGRHMKTVPERRERLAR